MSFADAGLTISDALAASFRLASIVEPTAIQSAAIPAILAGQDVLLESGTGTGKTLAYLLPLLQRVRSEPGFMCLIVAPAPELAIQILRVVEAFKGPELTCASMVGGGNLERQKDRLKKHPQVVVGTPGRVLEMIFAKKIKTRNIGALVLDETDAILSGQHHAGWHEIASRPEFAPQVILASALLGDSACTFAQQFMKPDAAHLKPSPQKTPATIRHCTVGFSRERKEVSLLHLLRNNRINKAIVFVNKLQHVAHLHTFLNEHAVRTVGISAKCSKHEREQAMRALRQGDTKLLVATDAAARGLDVADLPWVIHYEVARDAETYLHRAGRTGRAGKQGTSVSLVAPPERFLLKRYAAALDIEFESLSEPASASGQ